MEPLQIAFVPLARPTFDIPLAQEITTKVRQQLEEAGFALNGPEALVMDQPAALAAAAEINAEPPDLLLILQSTFADSTMLTTLAEATDAPLLLWAIPESPSGERLRLNSLCGINLGGHALTLRQRKYDYAYAPAEDSAALQQIRTLAQAGRARRLLKEARIGMVGEHPAGMDSCHLDAESIRATFGSEVVQLQLEALLARMEEAPAAEVAAVRSELAQRLSNLQELEQNSLAGTLSAFVTLNELAQEEGLNGLAVRCWPEFFEKRNCAACGALSLLNEAHLPASCEADANGTVTQLMLQALSNEPTFDFDLVSADVEADKVVIWHCGKAPLTMADPAVEARGGIHSNRKVPLVMEFPLKPGRVTAARLSRATGELRLVVAGGEMLAAPASFSGTSGVLRFDRPAGEVLDTILSEGLEHHLALTYGDYKAALLALAGLLDLPVLELA